MRAGMPWIALPSKVSASLGGLLGAASQHFVLAVERYSNNLGFASTL